MKMLVDYILKGSSPDGDGKSVGRDEEVLMEQEKLQQLCLYQLVLGYRLREAEGRVVRCRAVVREIKLRTGCTRRRIY